MSKKYRYVEGEPSEGTLTKGVVYWVDDEKIIYQMLGEKMGLRPIGYVVVDENEEDQCEDK